jgi:hypothetical protein
MIYILVRRTTNWADEATFWAQAPSDLRPKVEVWNQTFEIPFHLFRQRVWEIAQKNLSKVEDSVRAEWDEIPDGALVVPTDDDDWLAPEVGRVLESERDSRASCYYWISSFIQLPINLRHRIRLMLTRCFPQIPPRWICTTNNYAFVKNPGVEPLLRSHMAASRWVESQGSGQVKKIGRRLSIMNRTLGSLTSLAFKRPVLSRRELIRKYENYKRLYARRAGMGRALRRSYA